MNKSLPSNLGEESSRRGCSISKCLEVKVSGPLTRIPWGMQKVEMFRVPEKERTLGKKARDSVKSDQKDTFLFLLDKAGAPEARVIVIEYRKPPC